MTLPSTLKTPFARQCLGAVIGAVLALGLYNVSTWTYGKMEAMLMHPETHEQVSKQTQDAKLDRIAADAKNAIKD
jgi:hypothetical protein